MPPVRSGLIGVIAAAVVLSSGVGASAQTAAPGPWGDGYTTGGGVGISAGDGQQDSASRASDTGGTSSTGGGGSTGATTCTSRGVTGPISSEVVPDNVIEAWYTSGGHAPSWAHGYSEPGTFYYVYCGGEYLDVEYVPTGTPPPGGGAPAPAIDPRVLAVAASKNIRVGEFEINLSPSPPTDQLVGLPMWMWVSGDALGVKSDSVTAGTVTVTATAKATAVVFDMGDGHSVTCTDPDATKDPTSVRKTSCSYTYPRSSAPRADHAGEAYTITARVTWAVNYTVAGAAGGGPLPAITRTTTATVRVAEQQVLNTN